MTDLRFRIADEISGIQVGSGYESTTIGITAALEAADALIAAGVVAEEPEWEYGVGWNYPGASAPMGSRSPSRQYAEDLIRRYPEDPDFGRHYLVRRERERPAGPWVPVAQEN